MERYHIFKLGLAILFYAAYCIRPMLVNGLRSINKTEVRPEDYYVFYQVQDGTPGVDFPILSNIPRTTFSCKNIESGYYADLDTDCQVFHICEEGRKISFLCPNGTIFDQSDLICEWWFKVDCNNSPNLYHESAEFLREDIARRKAFRKVALDGRERNHGAVMRVEESSSISARKGDKNIISGTPNAISNNGRIGIQGQSRSFASSPSAIDRNGEFDQQKPKRYNDAETGNYLNNVDEGKNLKEYHVQFSGTSSGLETASSERHVQTRSTTPSSLNTVSSYQGDNQFKNQLNGSRGKVKYRPSFEGGSTVKPTSDYDLEFPKHKSEIVGKGATASAVRIDSDKGARDSSGELQVPQETASFAKNTINSLQSTTRKYSTINAHPNHRPTYSDLKQPSLSVPKLFGTINSVTPQYITTQSINSGKPFVGSTVGVNVYGAKLRSTTVQPNTIAAEISPTYPSSSRPIIGTSPEDAAGSTGSSISEIPVSSTFPPLDRSTKRTLDHATVYGTFSEGAATTAAPPGGVGIRFGQEADKVSVQLSKIIGGETPSKSSRPDGISGSNLQGTLSGQKAVEETPKYGTSVKPPLLTSDAIVHVGDLQGSVSSTTVRGGVSSDLGSSSIAAAGGASTVTPFQSTAESFTEKVPPGIVAGGFGSKIVPSDVTGISVSSGADAGSALGSPVNLSSFIGVSTTTSRNQVIGETLKPRINVQGVRTGGTTESTYGISSPTSSSVVEEGQLGGIHQGTTARSRLPDTAGGSTVAPHGSDILILNTNYESTIGPEIVTVTSGTTTRTVGRIGSTIIPDLKQSLEVSTLSPDRFPEYGTTTTAPVIAEVDFESTSGINKDLPISGEGKAGVPQISVDGNILRSQQEGKTVESSTSQIPTGSIQLPSGQARGKPFESSTKAGKPFEPSIKAGRPFEPTVKVVETTESVIVGKPFKPLIKPGRPFEPSINTDIPKSSTGSTLLPSQQPSEPSFSLAISDSSTLSSLSPSNQLIGVPTTLAPTYSSSSSSGFSKYGSTVNPPLLKTDAIVHVGDIQSTLRPAQDTVEPNVDTTTQTTISGSGDLDSSPKYDGAVDLPLRTSGAVHISDLQSTLRPAKDIIGPQVNTVTQTTIGGSGDLGSSPKYGGTVNLPLRTSGAIHVSDLQSTLRPTKDIVGPQVDTATQTTISGSGYLSSSPKYSTALKLPLRTGAAIHVSDLQSTLRPSKDLIEPHVDTTTQTISGGGDLGSSPKYGSAVNPPLLKTDAVVHVSDLQSTLRPSQDFAGPQIDTSTQSIVSGSGGPDSSPKYGSAVNPPLLKTGAVVHVSDLQSTLRPSQDFAGPQIDTSTQSIVSGSGGLDSSPKYGGAVNLPLLKPGAVVQVNHFQKTLGPIGGEIQSEVETTQTTTSSSRDLGRTERPLEDEGISQGSVSTAVPEVRTGIPTYGSTVLPPLLETDAFVHVSDLQSTSRPAKLVSDADTGEFRQTTVSDAYVFGKKIKPTVSEGVSKGSGSSTPLPSLKSFVQTPQDIPKYGLKDTLRQPNIGDNETPIDINVSQNTIGSTLAPDAVSFAGSFKSKPSGVPPLVTSTLAPNSVLTTASPHPGKGFAHPGFYVTKNSVYDSLTSSPLSPASTVNYVESTPFVNISPHGGGKIEPLKTTLSAPKIESSFDKDIPLTKSETQWPRPFQSPNSLQDDKEKATYLPTESTTPGYLTYKISSARPFKLPETRPAPTLPSPFTTARSKPSIYENVGNMINILKEIVNATDEDFSSETPRPGLIVPPSAGPQTLHTLAVYFANALDGIAAEREKLTGEELDEDDKEKLTNLLTQMTMYRYKELFKGKEAEEDSEATTVATDVEGEAENIIPTPALRELARNFSLALSSYLGDPEAFRKDLENLRPTEPPPLSEDATDATVADEELLNFSDADSKPSFPAAFPTLPSVSPTWGYIVAPKTNDLDVKNSLNPDLHTSDTQSFVPGFNNLPVSADKGSKKGLPQDHWTTSPGATKLWQSAFSVNPAVLNQQFVTTEPTFTEGETESYVGGTSNLPDLPHTEVQYDLRALPKISLNSTEVQGLLIDFINTTKSDESNRLQRILKRLNTSEAEFLNKMKEIESNPLTKRLILLLISECGANVTKDIDEADEGLTETLQPSHSSSAVSGHIEARHNSGIPELVDPNLQEEEQDTRALHLLNSLYTIAAKFGK